MRPHHKKLLRKQRYKQKPLTLWALMPVRAWVEQPVHIPRKIFQRLDRKLKRDRNGGRDKAARSRHWIRLCSEHTRRRLRETGFLRQILPIEAID